MYGVYRLEVLTVKRLDMALFFFLFGNIRSSGLYIHPILYINFWDKIMFYLFIIIVVSIWLEIQSWHILIAILIILSFVDSSR